MVVFFNWRCNLCNIFYYFSFFYHRRVIKKPAKYNKSTLTLPDTPPIVDLEIEKIYPGPPLVCFLNTQDEDIKFIEENY